LLQGDESLAIRWDVAALPFLGIWLCQGGWPEARPGDFTVALEPCNGHPDALAEAVEQARCRTLAPGEAHSFWLELDLGDFPRRLTGATYTGASP
jgi:galactose mutarotase-like enzyme